MILTLNSAEENLALYNIDKELYPDFKTDYIVDGYKVMIMRKEYEGNNNGYVYLPEGHLYHGWFYDNINDDGIEVHGGLTFSGPMDGQWLIGFDTAHWDDSCPLEPRNRDGHYWTHEEVLTELKRLVAQMIEKSDENHQAF